MTIWSQNTRKPQTQETYGNRNVMLMLSYNKLDKKRQ